MAIDQLLIAVVTAFGVYRTARMVADERGPFDWFTKIQNAVFDRYGENSWQYEGFTCPLCVGFWFALAGAIIAFGWNFWVWWLPIAGLQAWLQKQERS